MKEKEITSLAEMIREMIPRTLHNQQLKIEVKRGLWRNVWAKLQMK
jgi:hypothetical protein